MSSGHVRGAKVSKSTARRCGAALSEMPRLRATRRAARTIESLNRMELVVVRDTASTGMRRDVSPAEPRMANFSPSTSDPDKASTMLMPRRTSMPANCVRY